MDGSASRRPLPWRALGVSLIVHAAALIAVLALRPPAVEPPPASALLTLTPQPPFDPPRPAPAREKSPSPSAAATPAPVAAAVPAKVAPRVLPQPSSPLVATATASPAEAPGVGEGELVGAARAGSGGAGRGCDMVQRIQDALRRDARVRAAVGGARVARGRTLLVWDGDWVATPGEEGRGLAALREALSWEVAFAPEACRRESMRGLVLIALDDGPAPARLALGAAAWRWTDMLGAAR